VAGCRLSDCVNQVDRRRLLLHIPIRMRRPACAREALGLSPLVQARRADASRIERVPLIAAGAEPLVLFPGRPATLWTPDARATGVEALFLVEFSIHRDRLVILDGEHAQYYDSAIRHIPTTNKNNSETVRVPRVLRDCSNVTFAAVPIDVA
jgi:hypothetical protein